MWEGVFVKVLHTNGFPDYRYTITIKKFKSWKSSVELGLLESGRHSAVNPHWRCLKIPESWPWSSQSKNPWMFSGCGNPCNPALAHELELRTFRSRNPCYPALAHELELRTFRSFLAPPISRYYETKSGIDSNSNLYVVYSNLLRREPSVVSTCVSSTESFYKSVTLELLQQLAIIPCIAD